MTAPLHVLVDATAIPGNRGGVGRYLQHLLPALAEQPLRLTIAAQSGDREWLAGSVAGADVVVPKRIGSRPLRLLWEQFGLPALARRVGADVVFSPHYTMPLFTRRPVTVTFHDATFFSHPELHLRTKGVFFRTWMKLSARRAKALVVPSAATGDELERWTKVAHDHVHVAHHGVDEHTFHAPTAEQLGDAAKLVGSPHWIAFLGTIEPRKNVGNLVRAFAAVAADAEVARRYPGLRLALAGGRGWDDTIEAAIVEADLVDRVDLLGFVDDARLSGLLGGALAVAYPSLGEGFGMPVAEAMACGAPVVTTPLLSLPEVGGDAAVYADPDAASIATALTALLLDDADRARRARRGVERAAGFTWAASADVHRDAFESAGALR